MIPYGLSANGCARLQRHRLLPGTLERLMHACCDFLSDKRRRKLASLGWNSDFNPSSLIDNNLKDGYVSERAGTMRALPVLPAGVGGVEEHRADLSLQPTNEAH